MDRKKDYDEGFLRTKARVIDDISSFAALFALCLSSILMRQESDSLVSVPVGLLRKDTMRTGVNCGKKSNCLLYNSTLKGPCHPCVWRLDATYMSGRQTLILMGSSSR